jgi:hypothetical protein
MLAVMAAKAYGKFDKILMHNNRPPEGNPHWDRVAHLFELVPTEPPALVGSIPLEYVQYQSDVLRLNIIIEHGGYYLDTDTLVLRNLSVFGDRKLTLCRESPDSIAMAPIIAKPGSEFLKLWRDKIPEYMASGKWASHAVNLPHDLAAQNPYLCVVESQELFFPMDLRENYLLLEAIKHPQVFKRMFNAYAIHAYETYFRGQFDHINDAHMLEFKSMLALLVGDLIKYLQRYN